MIETRLMSQIETILIFFFLNLFLLLSFDKIRLFQLVVDSPDKLRKFHKKPTALAGGIILMINISLYYLIFYFSNTQILNEIIFDNKIELSLFVSTCLFIFLLGLFDDKFNLRPLIKFFISFLIITFFIYFNQSIKIETVNISFLGKIIFLKNYSYFFTIFCFLVFLNAFNMFDGINLQASSYSLIIFSYFLFLTQTSLFIYMSLIFILTFMYLNFCNKSFLGDGGSLLISFIISFIFIKLFNEGVILHSDTIFIYMMIPGIDMIRLFFERIKNKKNPLSFDRSHIHHLLIKDLTHLKANLIINSLIIIPVVFNYLNFNKLVIITITICSYALLIFYLKQKKKVNF